MFHILRVNRKQFEKSIVATHQVNINNYIMILACASVLGGDIKASAL